MMGSDIATGGAVVAGIVTIFWAFNKFIAPLLLKKETNGHKTNGKSGDRTEDYWKVEIRKIIEEVMDKRNDKIRVIVEDAVERGLKR